MTTPEPGTGSPEPGTGAPETHRRSARRLLLRVLIVQVITLLALYWLQLRYGIGAGA